MIYGSIKELEKAFETRNNAVLDQSTPAPETKPRPSPLRNGTIRPISHQSVQTGATDQQLPSIPLNPNSHSMQLQYMDPSTPQYNFMQTAPGTTMEYQPGYAAGFHTSTQTNGHTNLSFSTAVEPYYGTNQMPQGQLAQNQMQHDQMPQNQQPPDQQPQDQMSQNQTSQGQMPISWLGWNGQNVSYYDSGTGTPQLPEYTASDGSIEGSVSLNGRPRPLHQLWPSTFTDQQVQEDK
jgi:hypothetical protein